MKLKCIKCNRVFDHKMFKQHIKNSHIKDFINIDELEYFVLVQKFGLTEEIISRIVSDYQSDGTVSESVKKYNIPYKSLVRLLKLKNIKIKGVSESVLQLSVRNRYKNTCQLKYGVENVSMSNLIKNKKRNTFLKNFGFDNIFKTIEFKESINKIMFEKYGVKRISSWHSLSEEQRLDRIKKLNSGPVSQIEKRVGFILDMNNIGFETQFPIKNLLYDYHIKNTNLLIEVNGDFWHGNPKKYKACDILSFPNGQCVIVKDLWAKDIKKNNLAIKNNFKVITLWEMDIRQLNDVELAFFILEKLND